MDINSPYPPNLVDEVMVETLQASIDHEQKVMDAMLKCAATMAHGMRDLHEKSPELTPLDIFRRTVYANLGVGFDENEKALLLAAALHILSHDKIIESFNPPERKARPTIHYQDFYGS